MDRRIVRRELFQKIKTGRSVHPLRCLRSAGMPRSERDPCTRPSAPTPLRPRHAPGVTHARPLVQAARVLRGGSSQLPPRPARESSAAHVQERRTRLGYQRTHVTFVRFWKILKSPRAQLFRRREEKLVFQMVAWNPRRARRGVPWPSSRVLSRLSESARPLGCTTPPAVRKEEPPPGDSSSSRVHRVRVLGSRRVGGSQIGRWGAHLARARHHGTRARATRERTAEGRGAVERWSSRRIALASSGFWI